MLFIDGYQISVCTGRVFSATEDFEGSFGKVGYVRERSYCSKTFNPTGNGPGVRTNRNEGVCEPANTEPEHIHNAKTAGMILVFNLVFLRI